MIEDIERIEVISGPGATLWGANAVNGVINIITRNSTETLGTLVSVGRWKSRERCQRPIWRSVRRRCEAIEIYAKGFQREALDVPTGGSADDGWFKTQAGFRTDWKPGCRYPDGTG